MVGFRSSKTGLELNISIAEAKDLVFSDKVQTNQSTGNTKLNYNPKCSCTILPRAVSNTKKVKSSISPNWNETVKLPLRKPKLPAITRKKSKLPPSSYLILNMTVWDCQKTRKNYLGELRISVIDILQELQLKKETEYRWFRMYSSVNRKRFVTGSIKCKFSISMKSGRDTLDEITLDTNFNDEEYMEEDEEELLESDEDEPSDANKNGLDDHDFTLNGVEEIKMPVIKPQEPQLAISILKYMKLLNEVENYWTSQGYNALSLLEINNQNLYSNKVIPTAAERSSSKEDTPEMQPELYIDQDSELGESDVESDMENLFERNASSSSSTPINTLSSDNHLSLVSGTGNTNSHSANFTLNHSHRTPFINNLNNDSRFLLPDLQKEKRSDSITSISSMASTNGLIYSSADDFTSDNHIARSDFSNNDNRSKKRRPKLNPLRSRRKTDSLKSSNLANDENKLPAEEQVRSKYVFKKRKELKGLLFMEIISASGLPPFQNATRTGFDMDPFVVVSFGKYIARTSWRAHSLNPVFNERLYFEVMETEKNFNVAFDILDKDKYSFNDKVCNAAIPMRLFFLKNHIVPDPSSSRFKVIEPLDDSDDTMKRGVFRRNPSKNLSNTNIHDEYLTTLEIDMELRKDLLNKLRKQYHEEIYNPKIKIRFRYEDYNQLRKKFWLELLNNWKVTTSSQMDIIELSSFLQSIGSNLSDEKLNDFFRSRNRNPWAGESLTFDECIDCFETEIDEIERNSTNTNQIHVISIERCPLCGNSRLNKLDDNDIVTHLAVCGSKDWSSVTKILKASFTTSDSAKRRWFSKALIKIAYGRLKIGDNNANILVQDRDSGLLLEEKMSIYVRLGIRLLYRSFENKASNRRKIRKMLKNSSLKQGLKFDNPNSTHLIPSFIKFYSLDMSDYLHEDPSSYNTFNEFFYRKLKPTARKIEAKDDNRVATSGADCRCTVFQSVKSATELWIKGRGFTIKKLLGNNYSSELIEGYSKGSIVIFRLAPQDYHRFHSSVTGRVGKIHYIEGEYYTVNPMAIRSGLDVYGENVRVLVPIITEEFGTVMMCCIGAMMVGSTVITVKEGDFVEKGDEIGYFKFGGSTVVLLFPEGQIKLDSDILHNSKNKTETLIRLGMSIGHTHDSEEYVRQFHDFKDEPEEVQLRIMRSLTGGGFLSNGQHETPSISATSDFLHGSDGEILHGHGESLDQRVLSIPSWEVQHLDLEDAVEFEIEEQEREHSLLETDRDTEEAISDECNSSE